MFQRKNRRVRLGLVWDTCSIVTGSQRMEEGTGAPEGENIKT